MNLIEWKEEYQLGIPEIDKQHYALIQMINLLINSFNKGGELKNFSRLLYEFVQKLLYHFSFEEFYLKKHKPHLVQEHAAEHEKKIVELKFIQQKLQQSTLKIDQKLLEYLKTSFIDHILNDDKKIFL